MYIKLSGQYEAERSKRAQDSRVRPSWEYYRSKDRADVLQHAREMNWKENLVMVKQYGEEYVVEPFEICGCPNVVPFED